MLVSFDALEAKGKNGQTKSECSVNIILLGKSAAFLKKWFRMVL